MRSKLSVTNFEHPPLPRVQPLTMKLRIPTEDVIQIAITEKDRQKARVYCENGSCLAATALLRMGYSKPMVDSVGVSFGGNSRNGHDYYWREGYACNAWSSASNDSLEAPFYDPEVVGRVFILDKAEPHDRP